MYSVPDVDVQQAPEMIEGDSEFLEQFKQEVDNEPIPANK